MKNKTLHLLLPLLAFSAFVFAPTIHPDHLKSLNPRNIGTAGMSGFSSLLPASPTALK